MRERVRESVREREREKDRQTDRYTDWTDLLDIVLFIDVLIKGP